MDSTQRRMIAVAVVVSGFAVGMAGLLNYFKYHTTAAHLVSDRLNVTGRSIENAVQAALDTGLQFGDLGTLPATLDRERGTDPLITGIDVFDEEGRMLYSTDRLRSLKQTPTAWMEAVKSARGRDWIVEGDVESAAGMSLKNSFGLTLAYVAMRYGADKTRGVDAAVARDLALNSLGLFVASSVLSSLALLVVMRRLNRDIASTEAVLRGGDLTRQGAQVSRGPFGQALQRFVQTTRGAEREIGEISARLQRGAQ